MFVVRHPRRRRRRGDSLRLPCDRRRAVLNPFDNGVDGRAGCRRAADPGDRQLRQLRLQPRAVPRRARRRAGRPSQRRPRRRRGDRPRARRRAAVARPGATGGRRHPVRGDPRICRRRRAGARRVPRSPGDRPRLRRDDRPGAGADARQDVADRARRRWRVRRSAVTADGDPLSLVGDRPVECARLPRGHGSHRRRHGDGAASP